MKPEVLFEEYREGVLECLHYGTACVVDENGVVTGVAAGSAVITATFGGLSKSCTVTVT